MIQLTIDNSTCEIQGISGQQEKELRELLSYTPDPSSAFFSGGFVRKQCLMDKKGNFPTGLISYVLSWANSNNIAISIRDLRRVPAKNKFFVLRLS